MSGPAPARRPPTPIRLPLPDTPREPTPPDAAAARGPFAAWIDPARRVLAATERRLLLALSLLGATLASCAIFYGLLWPLTPGRMERPASALIDRLPLWAAAAELPPFGLDDPRILGVALVLFATLAFLAYGAAIVLTWARPYSLRSLYAVSAGAIVLLYLSLWAMPNANTDIYNYMARGRVAAAHGENPYYTAVDSFPDDAVYPYASHRYTGHAGGKLPTWMIFNVFLARISGDDPVTNLFVYRGALVLFTLATLGLVGYIAARIDPRFTLAALVAWGWNPIVTVFGPGKTDVVMVFFLLLAVAFLVSAWRRAGAFALGLSIWVKLITAPLVVVYLAQQLRHRQFRELAVTCSLLLAATITVYLPFAETPFLPFEHLLMMEEGGAASASWVKPFLMLGFLLLIPWVGLLRDGTDPDLLRGWAIVLLYFSLFLTNFALSWYLITLVAVAALTFDWRVILVTGLLGFSSFLLNTWNASATDAFRLPEMMFLHRHLFYLLPLLLVGTAIAAVTLWQRRQP